MFAPWRLLVCHLAICGQLVGAYRKRVKEDTMKENGTGLAAKSLGAAQRMADKIGFETNASGMLERSRGDRAASRESAKAQVKVMHAPSDTNDIESKLASLVNLDKLDAADLELSAEEAASEASMSSKLITAMRKLQAYLSPMSAEDVKKRLKSDPEFVFCLSSVCVSGLAFCSGFSYLCFLAVAGKNELPEDYNLH
eukprot:TRINITY_DN1567_c2_g1_i1.p1 TRINITY_DN1567_c2_g1~~TRINITY_DN1567_c2_g1_i1.p1  ORF type:complete len:197 (+),score=30.00 TRINITY_DN1567_c2_g1_i1:40-630(+)